MMSAAATFLVELNDVWRISHVASLVLKTERDGGRRGVCCLCLRRGLLPQG